MNKSHQKHTGYKTNRFKPQQYLQYTVYSKGQSFLLHNKDQNQIKHQFSKTENLRKFKEEHNRIVSNGNSLKKEDAHTKRRKISGNKKPIARVSHSPYMSNSIEIQKLLRLLVPVKGPTDSLKLQIKKYNEMNMKNAEMHIVKKSQVFIDRMKAYALRMGLPENSKIFMMNSRDKHIKDVLLKRGWVQSIEKQSILFHLKWVYKDIPSEYNLLQEGQMYNHFKNNQQLTNKSNLQKNIKKMHYERRPSFPLSFDLQLNDDNNAFHQAYNKFETFSLLKKLTQCLQIFKSELYNKFINNQYYFQAHINKNKHNERIKNKSKHSDKFIMNLLYKDHDKLQKPTMGLLNNLFQIISYIATYLDLEKHAKYSLFKICSQSKFQMKYIKSIEDQIMYNPQNIVKSLSDFYVVEIFKMWNKVQGLNYCYGYENMWIMKPAGVSRGSGIIITDDISKINQMRHGKIIQKYIQYPLLLDCKRKFDIRQWILVKSFTPFKVYAYNKCYVRFSSQKYSNDKYENMQKHLTNFSQNKQSYLKRKILRQNMSNDALVNSSVLSEEQLQTKLGNRWPNIKQKIYYDIIKTINCCKTEIMSKQGCFQLFGFDVILDQQYKPYILEVNMSPACQNRSFLGIYLEDMANGIVDMIEGSQPTGWSPLRQQQYQKKAKNQQKTREMMGNILLIQAWWRKMKKMKAKQFNT